MRQFFWSESVFVNGDQAAHVVQGHGVIVGQAVGVHGEGRHVVAHVLVGDLIALHAVLEHGDVGMVHQILDVLLQAQIQVMHDRRMALADVAVAVQMAAHTGFEALVGGVSGRITTDREAEDKAELPRILQQPLAVGGVVEGGPLRHRL